MLVFTFYINSEKITIQTLKNIVFNISHIINENENSKLSFLTRKNKLSGQIL